MFAALVPSTTQAGAFLLPEGQGQFIAGIGYSEGSRRFDSSGNAVPARAYRKVEASGYLEYGWTSWLSLIAAPTLSHADGSATNSVTGSDSSALGARLQIFRRPDTIIAVQALIQPPIGHEATATAIADGGARQSAMDVRVLFGHALLAFGWPAFVDLEPGIRVRVDPFPDEARLDLAFGLRPTRRLMILIQDFNVLAPANGPLVARTAYSKLQASLVYDISSAWSVQAGAFRTIVGINALRETGPFAALWYRF